MATAKKITASARGEFWSISMFAEETGRTRETVSRRIGAAGQPISSIGSGNQKRYRCREVLPLLYVMDDNGEKDPTLMEPNVRLSYAKALEAEQRLAVSAGRLVPIEEVESELARVLKLTGQTFDSLPDILERDCGLAPAAVSRVEKVCDEVRTELANSLANGDDDDAEDDQRDDG